MRHRLRRQGIVPFAFALLLTVAAGLALAEEHTWAPAAGSDGAVTSSDLPSRGAHPDGREPDRPASKPGVGSRALTGHDGIEPAADEQTR